MATWNVRTLLQAGKLDNAYQEMNRFNISILGMSEIRRPGAGENEYNQAKFVFSGSDGGEKGVGVLLSPDTANYLEGYWPVSDRVLLVKVLLGYIPN